nr:MAG TPA: hypothetical protein [Caudoviricetes sp.]
MTNHQECGRIKIFPRDGAAYLLAVKWNGAAHSHLGIALRQWTRKLPLRV